MIPYEQIAQEDRASRAMLLEMVLEVEGYTPNTTRWYTRMNMLSSYTYEELAEIAFDID